MHTAVLGGVGSAQQSPLLSRLFDPNTTSLAQFFNAAFKTALVVGAMLAVLKLGYAGFQYMTTDAFGTKGQARETIRDAVTGLLLLLAVWLILNQINPQILNLNILQTVRPAATTPSNTPGTMGPPPGGGFLAPNQDPSIFGCGVTGCGPADDWGQYSP